MRGRWSWDKKATTESCKSVSTSFLKQHGYLCGLQWGGMKWTDGEVETGSIGFRIWVEEWVGEIRFQYTLTQGYPGEQERFDYPVKLVATPCRYGGQRWWFICPLSKNGVICNRRVLKLYFDGGKYFGCRHCYELTYQSCQKHDARVDRLCQDPVRLRQWLKSKDWSKYTLALKAAVQVKGFF